MAAVIKKAFKGGRTSEEAGEEEILYMCVCGFILLANTSVWLDFFKNENTWKIINWNFTHIDAKILHRTFTFLEENKYRALIL